MSELAADGIPVAVTCRVLKIARQPYYRWLAKPVTNAEYAQACRANALFDAHRDDPEFGYRYLADEARHYGGQAMCDRTAWAICASNGWWGAFGKPKRSKVRRPGPPVHDDLVQRAFTTMATGPNQVWFTDIPPQAGGAPSSHATAEGTVYMCAMNHAWSGRIVGYSINSRMTSRLAVNALENAVAARAAQGMAVAGCIVHADRGSQFRSGKFVAALHRHELRGSMGRVATCADNAAIESWWALLGKNVLDRHQWSTREQLWTAIITWIERTYHRRRRQARLGRLTPIEYETIMTTQTATAA